MLSGRDNQLHHVPGGWAGRGGRTVGQCTCETKGGCTMGECTMGVGLRRCGGVLGFCESAMLRFCDEAGGARSGGCGEGPEAEGEGGLRAAGWPVSRQDCRMQHSIIKT